MVETSSTIGNPEKSSGLEMNRTTIRISTDSVIDSASDRSSSQGGIGRISTTSRATTPSASMTSPRITAFCTGPIQDGSVIDPAGRASARLVLGGWWSVRP